MKTVRDSLLINADQSIKEAATLVIFLDIDETLVYADEQTGEDRWNEELIRFLRTLPPGTICVPTTARRIHSRIDTWTQTWMPAIRTALGNKNLDELTDKEKNEFKQVLKNSFISKRTTLLDVKNLLVGIFGSENVPEISTGMDSIVTAHGKVGSYCKDTFFEFEQELKDYFFEKVEAGNFTIPDSTNLPAVDEKFGFLKLWYDAEKIAYDEAKPLLGENFLKDKSRQAREILNMLAERYPHISRFSAIAIDDRLDSLTKLATDYPLRMINPQLVKGIQGRYYKNFEELNQELQFNSYELFRSLGAIKKGPVPPDVNATLFLHNTFQLPNDKIEKNQIGEACRVFCKQVSRDKIRDVGFQLQEILDSLNRLKTKKEVTVEILTEFIERLSVEEKIRQDQQELALRKIYQSNDIESIIHQIEICRQAYIDEEMCNEQVSWEEVSFLINEIIQTRPTYWEVIANNLVVFSHDRMDEEMTDKHKIISLLKKQKAELILSRQKSRFMLGHRGLEYIEGQLNESLSRLVSDYRYGKLTSSFYSFLSEKLVEHDETFSRSTKDAIRLQVLSFSEYLHYKFCYEQMKSAQLSAETIKELYDFTVYYVHHGLRDFVGESDDKQIEEFFLDFFELLECTIPAYERPYLAFGGEIYHFYSQGQLRLLQVESHREIDSLYCFDKDLLLSGDRIQKEQYDFLILYYKTLKERSDKNPEEENLFLRLEDVLIAPIIELSRRQNVLFHYPEDREILHNFFEVIKLFSNVKNTVIQQSINQVVSLLVDQWCQTDSCEHIPELADFAENLLTEGSHVSEENRSRVEEKLAQKTPEIDQYKKHPYRYHDQLSMLVRKDKERFHEIDALLTSLSLMESSLEEALRDPLHHAQNLVTVHEACQEIQSSGEDLMAGMVMHLVTGGRIPKEQLFVSPEQGAAFSRDEKVHRELCARGRRFIEQKINDYSGSLLSRPTLSLGSQIHIDREAPALNQANLAAKELLTKWQNATSFDKIGKDEITLPMIKEMLAFATPEEQAFLQRLCIIKSLEDAHIYKLLEEKRKEQSDSLNILSQANQFPQNATNLLRQKSVLESLPPASPINWHNIQLILSKKIQSYTDHPLTATEMSELNVLSDTNAEQLLLPGDFASLKQAREEYSNFKYKLNTLRQAPARLDYLFDLASKLKEAVIRKHLNINELSQEIAQKIIAGTGAIFSSEDQRSDLAIHLGLLAGISENELIKEKSIELAFSCISQSAQAKDEYDALINRVNDQAWQGALNNYLLKQVEETVCGMQEYEAKLTKLCELDADFFTPHKEDLQHLVMRALDHFPHNAADLLSKKSILESLPAEHPIYWSKIQSMLSKKMHRYIDHPLTAADMSELNVLSDANAEQLLLPGDFASLKQAREEYSNFKYELNTLRQAPARLDYLFDLVSKLKEAVIRKQVNINELSQEIAQKIIAGTGAIFSSEDQRSDLAMHLGLLAGISENELIKEKSIELAYNAITGSSQKKIAYDTITQFVGDKAWQSSLNYYLLQKVEEQVRGKNFYEEKLTELCELDSAFFEPHKEVAQGLVTEPDLPPARKTSIAWAQVPRIQNLDERVKTILLDSEFMKGYTKKHNKIFSTKVEQAAKKDREKFFNYLRDLFEKPEWNQQDFEVYALFYKSELGQLCLSNKKKDKTLAATTQNFIDWLASHQNNNKGKYTPQEYLSRTVSARVLSYREKLAKLDGQLREDGVACLLKLIQENIISQNEMVKEIKRNNPAEIVYIDELGFLCDNNGFHPYVLAALSGQQTEFSAFVCKKLLATVKTQKVGIELLAHLADLFSQNNTQFNKLLGVSLPTLFPALDHASSPQEKDLFAEKLMAFKLKSKQEFEKIRAIPAVRAWMDTLPDAEKEIMFDKMITAKPPELPTYRVQLVGDHLARFLSLRGMSLAMPYADVKSEKLKQQAREIFALDGKVLIFQEGLSRVLIDAKELSELLNRTQQAFEQKMNYDEVAGELYAALIKALSVTDSKEPGLVEKAANLIIADLVTYSRRYGYLTETFTDYEHVRPDPELMIGYMSNPVNGLRMKAIFEDDLDGGGKYEYLDMPVILSPAYIQESFELKYGSLQVETYLKAADRVEESVCHFQYVSPVLNSFQVIMTFFYQKNLLEEDALNEHLKERIRLLIVRAEQEMPPNQNVIAWLRNIKPDSPDPITDVPSHKDQGTFGLARQLTHLKEELDTVKTVKRFHQQLKEVCLHKADVNKAMMTFLKEGIPGVLKFFQAHHIQLNQADFKFFGSFIHPSDFKRGTVPDVHVYVDWLNTNTPQANDHLTIDMIKPTIDAARQFVRYHELTPAMLINEKLRAKFQVFQNSVIEAMKTCPLFSADEKRVMEANFLKEEAFNQYKFNKRLALSREQEFFSKYHKYFPDPDKKVQNNQREEKQKWFKELPQRDDLKKHLDVLFFLDQLYIQCPGLFKRIALKVDFNEIESLDDFWAAVANQPIPDLFHYLDSGWVKEAFDKVKNDYAGSYWANMLEFKEFYAFLVTIDPELAKKIKKVDQYHSIAECRYHVEHTLNLDPKGIQHFNKWVLVNRLRVEKPGMYDGLMKDKSIRRPACIKAMSWEGILEEFKEFDYKLSEDLRSLSYVLNDSILEDFRRFLSVSEVELLDNYLSTAMLSEPYSWDRVEIAMKSCTDETLKMAYGRYVNSTARVVAPVATHSSSGEGEQQLGQQPIKLYAGNNRHTHFSSADAATPARRIAPPVGGQ